MATVILLPWQWWAFRIGATAGPILAMEPDAASGSPDFFQKKYGDVSPTAIAAVKAFKNRSEATEAKIIAAASAARTIEAYPAISSQSNWRRRPMLTFDHGRSWRL